MPNALLSGGLQDQVEVGDDAVGIFGFHSPLNAFGIVVRCLDADEYTRHHDHEIERDCGPLLVAQMRDDTA